ncbi:helix-turn-helix domain-containing protein [Rhizobium sp. LjRoot98]|uniref:ArsR/SmtB family transcription factor n=1 Tax=unclassified Rhizobium TaxID=2613769 RepID=UPI001910C3ED|nr:MULTISPECIES: helix-turn-helix domain-containing protein [unclassified Rhizobium]
MMNDHHPTREDLRLPDILLALGNPIRLAAVKQIALGECICSDFVTDVSKSTMTHHWRVLREAGVIRQRPEGRVIYMSLRQDDLEARFPGLLSAIFCADNRAGSA